MSGQTGSAKVTSTSEGLAALVGDVGGGSVATPCGNGPTLKSLVDVANAEEPQARPKSKAKAKAKAKVSQQQPATAGERRTAIRTLNGVYYGFRFK